MKNRQLPTSLYAVLERKAKRRTKRRTKDRQRPAARAQPRPEPVSDQPETPVQIAERFAQTYTMSPSKTRALLTLTLARHPKIKADFGLGSGVETAAAWMAARIDEPPAVGIPEPVLRGLRASLKLALDPRFGADFGIGPEVADAQAWIDGAHLVESAPAIAVSETVLQGLRMGLDLALRTLADRGWLDLDEQTTEAAIREARDWAYAIYPTPAEATQAAKAVLLEFKITRESNGRYQIRVPGVGFAQHPDVGDAVIELMKVVVPNLTRQLKAAADTQLVLVPGKQYQARDGNVWMCFKVDPKAERSRQALCVSLKTNQIFHFFYDGRHSEAGTDDYTLIAEVGVAP